MITELPIKHLASSVKDATSTKVPSAKDATSAKVPCVKNTTQIKITDLIPMKTVTPIKITDNLHSTERGFKYAFLEYNYKNYLNQYNSLHHEWLKTNSSLFTDNPYQAFFSQNGHLYHVFQFSTDFSLPTKRLFHTLHQPCSESGEIESELIYALHQLIKTFSTVSSALKKAIFYLSNNPDMLPYYHRLISSSILIDGNLCLHYPDSNMVQPYSAYSNTYLFYLSNINYCFINPEQILQDKKTLQTFLGDLKLNYNINKLLSQEFINIVKVNSEKKYKTQIPKVPYYLSVQSLFTAKHSILYFEKKSSSFISASLNSDLKFEDANLISSNTTIQPTSSFANSTYYVRINGKQKCTSAIADYLYQLTNGNLSLLDTLAKLYACRFCPESLKTSFMVIYDKNLSLSNVWDLLFPAVLPRKYPIPICNSILSLKDMVSNKNMLELISCQYSPADTFAITDCSPLKNEDKISIVKKIIAGSPISYNHKILGKTTLVNTLPLVFFTHSDAEINNLSSTFLPLKLNLTHITTNTFMPHNFSFYETEWLHINFALYGLSLLASDNKSSLTNQTQTESTPIPSNDDFFQEFTQNCCVITGNINDYVFNTDLYHSFTEYVSSVYHINACGQKAFTAKLNKLENIFPHNQRRDSFNHVRQCTLGIYLKENTYSKIPDTIQAKDNNADFKHWFELLSQIDNLVPDELYETENSPVDVNVDVKYQ